jgi:DNA-binding XRE family transcriptional regulator
MAPSRERQARRTWGQRVEERRTELRFSQETVAKISGLPQQTISRVELERHAPRYETMAAIAKALGTTVEDLFPIDAYPVHLRMSKKARAS